MNKREFLARLRKELSGLPQSDREERLAFYSEMIDDRMEEGLSEEDAVSAVGSVEEIAAQIVADFPSANLFFLRARHPRRHKPLSKYLISLPKTIFRGKILSLPLAAELQGTLQAFLQHRI